MAIYEKMLTENVHGGEWKEMSRKWTVTGLASIVFLAGCMPTVDQTEDEVIVVEETEEEEEQEYVITPSINTPDAYYRNVLEDGTYSRSNARGNVAHAMNNRVDIDQFELGLMEIASGVHDQGEYYFQEGNHLDGELINRWLRRYEPEQEDEDGEEDEETGLNIDDDEEAEMEIEESAGLNPPLADEEDEVDMMREAPLVLSNIIEHNYFTGNEEEGVELGGVVVGLSVRSVYYFRTETEDGLLNFFEEPVDEEYAIEYAEEAAGEMLQRMREQPELEDVPITFAIFREEPRGSVVPGTFRRMTEVGAGDMNIQGWESVSESGLVFPSSQARDNEPALSESFTQFKDEVDEFYDQPVGTVGRGRYKDESLDELKIEMNVQSHGKPEIIALTQFVSSRLETAFQSQAPVYVYIDSVEGREAMIIQYPGEEAFMHIYK